jgi:hypothetical protein
MLCVRGTYRDIKRTLAAFDGFALTVPNRGKFVSAVCLPQCCVILPWCYAIHKSPRSTHNTNGRPSYTKHRRASQSITEHHRALTWPTAPFFSNAGRMMSCFQCVCSVRSVLRRCVMQPWCCVVLSGCYVMRSQC